MKATDGQDMTARSRVRVGLLIGTGCLALVVNASRASAQSKASAPAEPDAVQSADSASPADIIVRGIRASAARAAEIKRNSDEIVDAISAEDLGKLPDTNIAEGLQRITGVQIDRSRGEGNTFQIRGSTENLVLVNGLEVAPDMDAGSAPAPVRQVNLFNYPSELFSEVRVYKSPAASLIEGGVGGTVDLRMPDPLTTPERAAISAQVGTFSLQKTPAYNASFVASHRFLHDTLGVIVGATYYHREVTEDSYSAGDFRSASNLDINGDGVADPNSVIPLNFTYDREASTRDRFTLNGLIVWKPSDAFDAHLNLSYISQTNPRTRSFIGFNFTSATNAPGGANAVTQQEDDGSTTVLAGTFGNVTNTQDALNQTDTRKLYNVAIDVSWKATDRLTLSGEVGRSWSHDRQFANVYQLTQNSPVVASYDIRPNVPTIDVVSGGSLDDASAYKAAVVNVRATGADPDLYQGRVDATYDLGSGLLHKLSIGGRITRQDFDFFQLNNRYANTFPIGSNIAATRFPQYLETRTLDNFLGGDGAGLVPPFVVANVAGTQSAGLALLNDFGDPGPLAPIPTANYSIRERTKAAYGQIDFGTDLFGRQLSGNVGVRFVRTELTSSSSAVTSDGSTQPITFHNNYDDWLPSLNLKYEVTHALILRASAAKVLARPPIPDLSAGTSVTFGINGLSQATSGQPLLKPFRADEYDVGAEYYFDDASYLSAALFYKDIKSYVINTQISGATLPGFPDQTFFLSAPSNGPGGVSKGLEIGGQRSLGFIAPFLRDFGVIANFTYVDSKRNGSDLQIENTSKYSYNVIGYFESGPFQIRAAYNWRSSQYLGLSRGYDIYARARGQLDASASIDVNPRFSVTVEANNILDTPQTTYSQFSDRTDGYVVDDRSILFGVRAKF